MALTRDAHIQAHRREIEVVRDNGAVLVALAGSEAVDTWSQLEVIMCNWRKIEALVGLPGPLIFTATRTSFVKVDLATLPGGPKAPPRPRRGRKPQADELL